MTSANDQIVLETTGYARGRQILDQRLTRVRVNGGSYRNAKSPDFDKALFWLQSQGYELVEKIRPHQYIGTITVKYIYRKAPRNGSIKTSGGSLLFEDGRVIRGSCSRCHKGGLLFEKRWGWVCGFCGNVIAKPGEVD